MKVCDRGVGGLVTWAWSGSRGSAAAIETIAGRHARVHGLGRLPQLVHEIGSVFIRLPIWVLALEGETGGVSKLQTHLLMRMYTYTYVEVYIRMECGIKTYVRVFDHSAMYKMNIVHTT